MDSTDFCGKSCALAPAIISEISNIVAGASSRTTGTNWGMGAISTARFSGPRLSEVLKLAGVDDPIAAQEKHGMEHVRFYALDGMSASIGIVSVIQFAFQP